MKLSGLCVAIEGKAFVYGADGEELHELPGVTIGNYTGAEIKVIDSADQVTVHKIYKFTGDVPFVAGPHQGGILRVCLG